MTNDLDVARQALRDGFFSLARAHAQASARDEGRAVILESWAREGKWADVLNTLAEWGNPTNDVCSYYRMLARAKSGDDREVRAAAAAALPTNAVYARLTARLIADRALAWNEPSVAVKAYAGVVNFESDDRLLLAEAQSRLGAVSEARELWREVLADTNATPRATVTAAANLKDEPALRKAATNDLAEVRLLARLKLGTVLLGRKETFDEGAKLVHDTARESPDAEGALEASRTLAAARLGRSDWAGAAKAYAEILEIWPAAARVASVQEGLGWAMLRQGRAEEALQAFRHAEECAATDAERASAGAKVADALAALGRLDESTAKCRAVAKAFPREPLAKRLASVVRLRELETEGRTLYRGFHFADAQKRFREVGAGDATRRGRMAFYEVLCLYGQGRDGEAAAHAREIVRSTDDDTLRADATLWLARASYNDGRWREAKDLFSAYATAPRAPAAEAAEARVWAARAALAANDFSAAIAQAALVVGDATALALPARAEALTVQGEALLELARFDEAALVFERAAAAAGASAEVRLEAQILRADALYAMGADNPVRYEQSLAAYRAIAQLETISDESRLTLAYKIGLALEKLKRRNEACDQYYTHVILAYREARGKGRRLGDGARAVFARAAFRLADLCEAGGHLLQAQKTLELVAESDVPAAAEATKRIGRLRQKGILP